MNSVYISLLSVVKDSSQINQIKWIRIAAQCVDPLNDGSIIP